MPLSDIELRLIDGWQRAFPLLPAPYDEIARRLGATEPEVLGLLSDLQASGVLSRIGAVVRPNTVGASTLAAMSVPAVRLEEVADLVSAEPGVNHNYEREHDFNLWFVVTGPDRSAVRQTLGRLARRTGYTPLNLPLERPYFIDLGFAIGTGHRQCEPGPGPTRAADHADRRFLAGFEDGLTLEHRPYRTVGARLGMDEATVLARLSGLIGDGIVSRFGLVVRHRELGYSANAMVVWNIADDIVDAVGERFAAQPFVTLCYRRPRRPPRWPYNLFCMVHGRERAVVLDQIEQLADLVTEEQVRPEVLFSRRRFKQRGARYEPATDGGYAAR